MVRSSRLWRRLALAAVALLAIALVTVAVLVATVDLEPLARTQLVRIEAATGRALTIKGPLSVRLLPRPVVVANDVAFANAPWGSRPHMAQIKRVEAALALWPLVRGRVEVVRLALVEPDIVLETDAKDRGNWELHVGRPAQPAPADTTTATPLAIGTVQVEKARLTWRPRGKTPTAIDIARLSLQSAGSGDTADVHAEIAVRGVPIAIDGEIGSVERLVARSRDWPVDARVSLSGAEARIVGRVDAAATPAVLTGKLDVKVSDFAALSAAAGTPINLPTPLSISAGVGTAASQVRLDPLSLELGKSKLTGSVGVQTGGQRPFVKAQLTADQIDLADVATRSSKPDAAATAAGGRLFGNAKLPFDALHAADGDATVKIARLKLANGIALANVQSQSTVKAGRLLADPVAFDLYGGSARVRADVRASPASAQTALAITTKGVDLGALLAQMGQRALTGGATDAQIELAMSGTTPREMAASASGSMRLSIGAARVDAQRVQWIAALLEALRPGSGGVLQLSCAAALLPLKSGVASVDRGIALESPQVDVVASGTIDLRNETLDLALRPTRSQGGDNRALRLAQLVRLHGPLQTPKVGIDTGRVVEEALALALRRGGLGGARTPAAADPNPCRTALSGRPAPAAAPQPTPQHATPPVDVEGALKRLFRR